MERNILLVESDAGLQAQVSEALASMYHVEALAEGGAALARLQTGSVALLIVGPKVQGMHGLDLIAAARADAAGATIPILALLSPGAPDQQRRARFAGATGWVKAPPDPVALQQAVGSLLR